MHTEHKEFKSSATDNVNQLVCVFK